MEPSQGYGPPYVGGPYPGPREAPPSPEACELAFARPLDLDYEPEAADFLPVEARLSLEVRT